MGCVCCSLSSFVSIVLNALERISLCTVCAMLVCCLLFTILMVMVMGIGIGFHYCMVQNSVEAMEKAAKAAGAMRRSGGGPPETPLMRSVSKAVKRSFAHKLSRRDLVDELMPSNNNSINDEILLGQNFTVLNNTVHSNQRDSMNLTVSTDNKVNDPPVPGRNFTGIDNTVQILEQINDVRNILLSKNAQRRKRDALMTSNISSSYDVSTHYVGKREVDVRNSKRIKDLIFLGLNSVLNDSSSTLFNTNNRTWNRYYQTCRGQKVK